MLTRRAFVTRLGAAVAVAQAAGVLDLVPAAHAQTSVDDTFNGLLAFLVPGTDPFSVAQGLTHPTPGGVEAGVLPALITSFDAVPSPQPPIPTSALLAGLLDQVAVAVDGTASGFADLAFADKMAVFAFLESQEAYAGLAMAMTALTGFLAFSEAGVLDPASRTLTGTPLGWTLTGYPGVADGRDELVGYYRNRKEATS